MTPEQTAQFVGVVGGSAGVFLFARPEIVCGLLGTKDPAGIRAIGAADIALIPGLLAGKPRWPWMVGRLAVNAGIVAYARTQAAKHSTKRPYAVIAGLAALSAADAKVVAELYPN